MSRAQRSEIASACVAVGLEDAFSPGHRRVATACVAAFAKLAQPFCIAAAHYGRKGSPHDVAVATPSIEHALAMMALRSA
eukprot:3678196-Rhodomonas_salina.2